MAAREIPQEDRTKLALSTATDSIKQVLTLSTVILTFTITFSKDVTKSATESDEVWLHRGWVLLGLAVLSGVWALLALTGTIGRQDAALDIYKVNVRVPAAIQMVAFALALGSIALFGLYAFSGDAPSTDSSGKCTIEAPASGTCKVGSP
jgi:hypothetical protein